MLTQDQVWDLGFIIKEICWKSIKTIIFFLIKTYINFVCCYISVKQSWCFISECGLAKHTLFYPDYSLNYPHNSSVFEPEHHHQSGFLWVQAEPGCSTRSPPAGVVGGSPQRVWEAFRFLLQISWLVLLSGAHELYWIATMNAVKL